MTTPRRRSDAIRERFCGSALAFAVSLALTSPRVARAQSNGESEAPVALDVQARRLFQQGLDALDRGRFVEAAQHFERSYRLRPSAIALVNLAVVFRSQGRFLDAQRTFQRAIREGASELLPDEQQRARNDLARLELAIPSVRIEGIVDGAQLRCDGVLIEGAGPVRELRLDPGTHVFNITAPRYEPEQRTLRMDPSTQQSVLLRMRRVPPPRLWVVLTSRAQDATVQVDGERWLHAGHPREIAIGTHRVRVSAPGFAPLDRTVLVPARTTVRFDAVLVRAPARVAPWVIALAAAGAVVTISAAVTAGAIVGSQREPLPMGLWDGPISTPAGMQR